MGRVRVGGGRAEGVSGKGQASLGGLGGQAPGEGGGEPGPGVEPLRREGRALEAARGQLSAQVQNSQHLRVQAIYGLEKRWRCPFAGLPASGAAPGASSSRLDGRRRGASGCGRGPAAVQP